jgi:hypothetical protein
MPDGEGYFYDRKKRKLILIFEHATDALERSNIFRTQKLKNLNATVDREHIVIYTLKQGFIRIRHYKGYLGWQFWGNAAGAKKTLKWFAKKKDVGDLCLVTFTDFKSGKNTISYMRDFYK